MKNRFLIFVCVQLLGIAPIEAQKITHFDRQSFFKPKENPILRADSTFVFTDPISKERVNWQRADVFNPAAIIKGDKVYLLYRCEDNPAAHLGGRTSRIGLAESLDGIHFIKHPTPVLYPDRDGFYQYDYPGGCEDPRITQTADGLYVLTYTAWNKEVARLSIAFSRDLIHWDKKGPAFLKAHDGKFVKEWSKSGSMVTTFKKGKQVLVKIKGKYWMYWGEHGINLAWSDNLYDWYPTLDSLDALKKIVMPRNYYFDSHLTECGPPAILTASGITLLYNGKNLGNEFAAAELPKNTYAVGQLIFDRKSPDKVIYRSDVPFLVPSLPHEVSGQYQAGTTFAEGMVWFKKRWFLYYGTADSFVGLAIGN